MAWKTCNYECVEYLLNRGMDNCLYHPGIPVWKSPACRCVSRVYNTCCLLVVSAFCRDSDIKSGGWQEQTDTQTRPRPLAPCSCKLTTCSTRSSTQTWTWSSNNWPSTSRPSTTSIDPSVSYTQVHFIDSTKLLATCCRRLLVMWLRHAAVRLCAWLPCLTHPHSHPHFRPVSLTLFLVPCSQPCGRTAAVYLHRVQIVINCCRLWRRRRTRRDQLHYKTHQSLDECFSGWLQVRALTTNWCLAFVSIVRPITRIIIIIIITKPSSSWSLCFTFSLRDSSSSPVCLMTAAVLLRVDSFRLSLLAYNLPFDMSVPTKIFSCTSTLTDCVFWAISAFVLLVLVLIFLFLCHAAD